MLASNSFSFVTFFVAISFNSVVSFDVGSSQFVHSIVVSKIAIGRLLSSFIVSFSIFCLRMKRCNVNSVETMLCNLVLFAWLNQAHR